MGDWKSLFTAQDSVPADKPKTWKELFGSTDSTSVFKEGASKLPNAPEWSNVIEPENKKTETAKGVGEFIIGGAAKFDEALAGMFNQLDYVQTSLGDAVNTILVGKETANGIKDLRNKYGVDVTSSNGKPSINSVRPFKAISNAIDWAYSGAKPLPDTMMGDIVGGIGSIGPEIIAAAVAPEIKAGQLLTSWGLPILSKFGTVMAAEGFVDAMEMSEDGKPLQKLTMPFVSAFEQYATGQMYDFMGGMSSKLGSKLAEKFIPEVVTAAQAHTSMLIHSLGTTSFNALMFGGHGTLSEFLETGKSSWRTFGTGAGMGIGLGAREVGKGLWAKGMHSLIASDMNIIRRTSQSDVGTEELISHAKNKIKAVEDKTSKNPEGDMASAVLTTNTAILKSVVDQIKEKPQDVLKAIEESTLPPEVKKQITEKINQISAELDPMVQESKPYTDKIADIDAQIDVIKKNDNIPPEVRNIKVTYLAEKRDKLVSQVVKLSQEPKPVSDEKKAEDIKQARILESKAAQVFPQFQAKGEEIATEFGGKFESRLKSVESITGKTAREGIDVLGVTDTMGGAIILGDMKDFKAVSKRLKKEGYSISNKRLANKETGRRGVLATKLEDGIGVEIQLHTEKTWEAQKKAEAIRDKYRKEGIPDLDVVDVETNPAKYRAEDQIKSHDEFGGSTFSVGGENLAGKKGKASVGIFPERSETITKTAVSEEQKAMAEPKFPEGIIPDMQKRKSGKDKVFIEDVDGNELSAITFKTVKIDGDKYWSIQQTATAEGNEGKGYATNLYKYAMQNLPEGYKGIISPESSRQNKVQIPKIHEKLAKIFDMQKMDNGDIIFKHKTEGLTTEEVKAFIEKNKDILEGNEDILSIGTWKKSSGEHVLDITATPSREKAIELGKKYNQESVFDLEKMEEIPTGGTGKNIDPATGKEYSSSIEDRVKELRVTPRSIYEEAMAQSRDIYEEGYAGLGDVDLEGSPAKTALEKKMKVLEIPMNQQKELKKSWTETKKKLLGELRGKSDEMKQAFKDYVKDMNITGLNVKLRKAMLNRVNEIDFNKPKSLERAIEYFDKIVDDATFRYNVIEYERTLGKLDHYTSPGYLLKKVNKIMKNKIGPTGLPLADELKSIRKDMLEGDWQQAQDALNHMLRIYEKENRPFTDAELAHITRLNFKGLLNSTNKADIHQLQGALRDMKDIIKVGKTKAAARRMIESQRIAELNQNIFDILNQKPGKPVQLDQHIATNERVSLATKLGMYVNWMQLDSWFTLLNKFSKWDKSSAPYQSVLNKVLGGAVVEADVNEYRAKTQKFTEVQDKFKEIYGTAKDSKIRRISHENTTTLHELKYNNLLGEPETRQMTMNQAYKVYMELQDPSLARANEAGGWMRDGELTNKGEALMNLLTPEAKAWADWQLNEFYPKYYDRINEVYRRIYGTDMPMNEKYSPIFVAEKIGSKQGSDVDSMLAEETVLSAASNGNLKVRTNHDKPLALIDGDKVLTNYIEKMEYFINWSDAMQLLNSTLVRNGDIRSALRQNFGPASLKVIDSFMTDFSRAPKDLHRVTQAMDNFRKNFTVASLAIKPTVFFAQLTALPAYMEQVPISQYVKYFGESAVHWTGKNGNLEIFDYIKNDPFWKERYMQGWDRDVIDSMQKDLMSIQGRNAMGKFRDMSMFLTKYGDMGAILVGGIPLYRYEYDRAIKNGATEREARARAMASFTDATRNSQQAGQVYDLSVIQRANSFTKLLTMYKTSPFQYHRKVVGAFRDLTHGRGNWQANVKTLAIYHVLLPQLFQMIGNGFKWDDKEQLQAFVLGNFNDVFVAGDIIKGIQNTVNGLPFAYQMTPIESTGKSAQQTVQHLKKSNIINAILEESENVSMPDLLKAVEDMAKVTGDITGTPMRGLYSIGKGVYDVAEGELEDKNTMHKVLRIMGWSEYALEAGSRSKFDDDFTAKKVKDAMTDDKNPTLHKIYELEDDRIKSLPSKGSKPLPSKLQKGMPMKNNKPLPSR